MNRKNIWTWTKFQKLKLLNFPPFPLKPSRKHINTATFLIFGSHYCNTFQIRTKYHHKEADRSNKSLDRSFCTRSEQIVFGLKLFEPVWAAFQVFPSTYFSSVKIEVKLWSNSPLNCVRFVFKICEQTIGIFIDLNFSLRFFTRKTFLEEIEVLNMNITRLVCMCIFISVKQNS